MVWEVQVYWWCGRCRWCGWFTDSLVVSQVTEVKMSVQYMSFSAHADAKGIMQLISWCEPR